ncbi:MAG: enoyl-CoA hydratase/isomerase family protein [Acidobacteriia bacterium]|nr:enoyl-CoA hydratase/isomerase family protein [Terriglobia bacterium]
MAESHENHPDFTLGHDGGIFFLTLVSPDGTNRLTRKKINALTEEIRNLASGNDLVLPLVISGDPAFSAGADLNEISQLGGPEAPAFASMGQEFMNVVERYPAPVYAAIHGYCMGGGLDLALACHRRIASPHAIFGHRGAALGLITGWGGTQRLPRLVGKAKALEMLVAAEKLHAAEALRIGLVDAVVEDPVAEAVRRLLNRASGSDLVLPSDL